MTPGTGAGSLQEGAGGAKKYICNVCGWVYDPARGDPDGSIPAGTRFEALPEGWVCPVCEAPKSDFSPVES